MEVRIDFDFKVYTFTDIPDVRGPLPDSYLLNLIQYSGVPESVNGPFQNFVKNLIPLHANKPN